MDMKAVLIIFGLLMVLSCHSAPGLELTTTDRALIRSEDDLTLICESWRSSTTGVKAKQQLLRAAASRDDMAKLAQAKLKEPGENICFEFYVEMLASRPHHEAMPILKEITASATLSRGLRMAAVQALESIAGPTYSPPLALDANGRPDIELRVKSILDWLGKNEPLAGDVATRAVNQISGCTGTMSERMRRSRSLDGHAFEAEVDCIQEGVGLLEASTDSSKAAQGLMEHLAQLQSLPAENPADELDQAIGLLEYQALYALQNHVGPVLDPGRDYQKRADVEPLVTELLKWWASANGLSPTEWRMQRLAYRGYKTIASESGASIGAELLRAVRIGSPADARAAADVLKSLRLSNGTVPMRDDSTRNDIALADTLIRGLVASEAAGQMLRGEFPVWDIESNAWKRDVHK